MGIEQDINCFLLPADRFLHFFNLRLQFENVKGGGLQPFLLPDGCFFYVNSLLLILSRGFKGGEVMLVVDIRPELTKRH